MRLDKVHVTRFRSVDDSDEFEIDKVTCLVGKNEAGKSAILLALAALNPNDATPVELDRERDYPRRDLIRYAQLHSTEEATAIRTTWHLDDSDVQAIASDLGPDVLTCPTVHVSRRYGQQIEVDAQLDDFAAIAGLFSLFDLGEAERAELEPLTTVDQVIEKLDALPSPTEKQVQLRNHFAEKGSTRQRLHDVVISRLPTFMYVSSYDRMDGAIQIEQTRGRVNDGSIKHDTYRGSQLFMEFLRHAGVPLDEITEIGTYETFNAMLQSASANITAQILDYWSQNPDIDVEVRIDQARPSDEAPFNSGTIARARIRNRLHQVDTPFLERSAGFVWFFSFLVKFARVKAAGGSVILLLDEPGLSLHGKAQGDLLRFIEAVLAPAHQVIYTTHSPFMVPADKLQHVRIVEDKVDRSGRVPKSNGTKVSQDVLKVDSDTLFPLQGALGYEASQTLFVGDHTLLVEGPSDILYLQALSAALKSRNRDGLDRKWTMCPAGGIDRIMPFVSLFAGKTLHVAVLSDEARGGKGKVDKIKQSDVLRAGHFFTIADFIDADEGDIEDVFDPVVLADNVNRAYELPEEHRIDRKALVGGRVVKRIEDEFKLMPESIPMFDHYTPAAWLIRNPGVLAQESHEVRRTLDVAERVFQCYNALLE